MAKTATKTAPARKAAATKAAKAPAQKAAAKTSAKAAAGKTPAKTAAKTAKKIGTAASSNGILTLRHIADTLAEMHELPRRQANEILTQVVELIAKSLKKGEKIRLSGLGILQVRKR
ncbi:HU family DNA-binding protein, partial [Microvirga vignae]|uniref:HU family DNA-binding protein n=1 Tax=Microvirga vignae TaxID=1225564 RepID=UPI00069AB99A